LHSEKTWRFIAALFLPLILSLSGAIAYPANCSSDHRWVITTDFLAWYASEEVASIWADVITIGDNASTWDARGFNFKWDYGFRLGATRLLDCDQWETGFYWTWFQTSHKQQIPFDPDSSISPEFFAAFLSGNRPKSMNGKWSLLLSMFDWELGKSFRVCKNLSLRPFLGIKGGWINQSIKANYYNLVLDSIIQTDLTAKERLKNNFWGVGPLVGVNSKWKVAHINSQVFSIFGDFSMASLFGIWSSSDFYKNSASQTASVTARDSALGTLMFRAFFGLAWEMRFSPTLAPLKAKIGYEAQIWMNQLRIATFQLQRLHNDLTLQGVTLSCEFCF
jgi:hypothetical protein